MPKRCVAANCSNTIADGVSLFRFPRDAARRRQWVLQVKRTRARWDFPAVYNASCVLCSDHFEADRFDPSSSVKLSVGYDLQHVLLDTAVPTIFARTVTLKEAAQHKSTAAAGASSSSTAFTVDVATVIDIDGSTLLVPMQPIETKVVADTTSTTSTTSSTRGRTSSKSVLAKKERREVRKFVHFASCKHWLEVPSVGRTLGQAGFGLACCCLD